LDGTLDAGEYKAIRTNLKPLIRDMEEKLGNLSQKDTNLDAMLKYGTYFFENLNQLYFTGELVIKQQVAGSMFPEKLIFENKSYRTAQDNPLLSLICTTVGAFSHSKIRKAGKIRLCPVLLPNQDLNLRPSD
jgi:site-specific DNA recombinase